MRHPIDSVRHPWLRRVVLGAAIVLGLAVALPGTHKQNCGAPTSTFARSTCIAHTTASFQTLCGRA